MPPIIGLYYGTLDIWGDEWNWVVEHKARHEFIFTLLAALTVVILFLKGVSQYCKGVVVTRYNLLVEGLLNLFGGLVKKKKDRFFNKAKTLKPRQNTFKEITHPKDQIEFLLDGLKNYLVNGFNIEKKNIGITIIQGEPEANKWWYAFKCDAQRQHTKARTLIDGQSTARYCLDSGDSIFISDIRKGIKDGVFMPSERSKKTDIGSIFCKPVRLHSKGKEYVYVFTLAIFGQHLCTPFDENECRACESILDEIADRVELELYLYSIKESV